MYTEPYFYITWISIISYYGEDNGKFEILEGGIGEDHILITFQAPTMKGYYWQIELEQANLYPESFFGEC